MNPTTLQVVGLVLFCCAVLHTFTAKYFERLGHRFPTHSGLFHFLGEVEAIFGIWAMVLFVYMMVALGEDDAVRYLETRNYTEPVFVFVIMVIAASKPIVDFVGWIVRSVTLALPIAAASRSAGLYFLVLGVVPLVGSLITEPAAMTLAALMLRDRIFSVTGLSVKVKYLTLGVLFVNISIGGVLTSYAAPPVLMVANVWKWDTAFMFTNFGIAAVIAVTANAALATWYARAELRKILFAAKFGPPETPWTIIIPSVAFLSGVVLFAHDKPVFLGLFLFFLGFAHAYPRFQERLILREALMVAFFLCGLVVLGGQQAWWLQPVMQKLSPDAVYFVATALTAVTDNAALTYLASLVPGLSDEFKYMVVAGAVTGGGLTVIANAPNPAGYAILKGQFPDGVAGAGALFLAALAPTFVAILCLYGFRVLF
jgi:Putative Na+/H+ antiporter